MLVDLFVCGDVHGKFDKFVSGVKGFLSHKDYCEDTYFLQLGDMGFNYSPLECLPKDKFSFFPGNHDRRPDCYESPYCLGKYGIHPLFPEVFFVSGGFSIDKKYRTPGISWWHDEELSYQEFTAAVRLYAEVQPKYLICHEPPLNWGRHIGNPDILREFGFDPDTFKSQTSLAIQAMIDLHKPEMVLHGHLHLSRQERFQDINFVSLGELEFQSIAVDRP